MPKGFSTNQVRDLDSVISNIQKNKKALRNDLKVKRELMTNFWHTAFSKNQYDTPAAPLALLAIFATLLHGCRVSQ